MNNVIEAAIKPRLIMLYHPTFQEARKWYYDNVEEIRTNGGQIDKSLMEIRFPNGNKIILGYGDDLNRYNGYEFMLVFGCSELNWRQRL